MQHGQQQWQEQHHGDASAKHNKRRVARRSDAPHKTARAGRRARTTESRDEPAVAKLALHDVAGRRAVLERLRGGAASELVLADAAPLHYVRRDGACGRQHTRACGRVPHTTQRRQHRGKVRAGGDHDGSRERPASGEQHRAATTHSTALVNKRRVGGGDHASLQQHRCAVHGQSAAQ
jgi:hypothetical protein